MKTKYKKLLLSLLAVSLAHTKPIISSNGFFSDSKKKFNAAVKRTVVAYSIGIIGALYANNLSHKIATPAYAFIGLPTGAIIKQIIEGQINNKNTMPHDRIGLPKYIFPMTGAFAAGYFLPILFHEK